MTIPITTTPRAKARGLLLKAAVVIPDLIIASLLWLMILALLPPAVAFLATILGITSAALAATGLGADAVVRVLYRARRPTASEAPRLAVAWRIAIHHSDTSDVTLRIVTHGPPIATGGRRHLLMRRDIVDAYVANGINAHQMAALIAQGIGRLRSGHTRFDLLRAVGTIPWDIMRGLARAIGVACHEHGTGVAGFLPGSWDHLDCQSWDHPACRAGGSWVGSLDRRVVVTGTEVYGRGIQGGQCG